MRRLGHAHEAREQMNKQRCAKAPVQEHGRIGLVLEHVLIKRRFVFDTNKVEIVSNYWLDLPLPASFSLFSRLRFTSQLYTRAVLTSIIVSCSLRNSRSSIVLFKLDCATSSLDDKRVIVAGNLYESITFACERLKVSQGISEILENVPQVIDKLYPYLRVQPPRKVCR